MPLGRVNSLKIPSETRFERTGLPQMTHFILRLYRQFEDQFLDISLKKCGIVHGYLGVSRNICKCGVDCNRQTLSILSDGNHIIVIPAGKIDEHETPLEAITREIREETGYNATDIEEIMEFYPSPGCLSEKVFLFMGIVNNSDKIDIGGGLKKEGEFIKILEISVEKVYEIIDLGGIRDAKTIIAIQEFRIKHQISMLEKSYDSIKTLEEKVSNLETKLVVLKNSSI